MNLIKNKRMMLTREEREMLLKKSNGKCAHCGKPLTLETVTCDHVIPAKKGDTKAFEQVNDYKNMVALCSECNLKKADTVIVNSLGFYYKYLDTNYLKQTIEYASNYIDTTSWITYRNFLPSDVTYFVGNGYVDDLCYLDNQQMLKRLPKTILKHVDYSDLDALYEYWIKRYKSLRGTKEYLTNEEIKQSLSNNFLTGGIYILISGASKEIIGTYTIHFDKSVSKDNITVPDISCVSCGKKHIELMASVINNQIVAIQNHLGAAGGVIDITVSKYEEGAVKAIQLLSKWTNGGLKMTAKTDTFQIYSIYFTKSIALRNQPTTGKSMMDVLKRTSNICNKHLDERNKDLNRFLSHVNYKKIMSGLWYGETHLQKTQR